MWTPKRILIYLGALLGFLAVFAVAFALLSWIDTLPKLPPQYWPGDPNTNLPSKLPPAEYQLRLRQAFGNECDELNRASKVWLPAKGAVVAINDFEIQKDGRVKLSPFSIGLFAKSKGDVRFPEITTVQCDYAVLTLDRPVTSLADMGRSKVVAVELGGGGGVKITNNRKSQEKNDDIELYVTGKPLFYEEARNLVWSNGFVKMLDTQSKPNPTQITAVGLEVNLSKDTAPNRDKKDHTPGKKSEGVNGVEKITLLTNVDMHFYVDARSGFMAPDAAAPKKADKNAPEEKAHVHINTYGRFVQDLIKDTARFDAPEKPASVNDRVKVTRHQNAPPPGKGIITDLLDCDHLELQFRKKPNPAPAATAKDGAAGTTASGTTASGATAEANDKEIESAIATANVGGIVELHVEGEEMHAFGAEMRYYAPTPKAGPRTILKGSPMHAMRQGHQIRCEELHISGANAQGEGQEAFGKGPGKIDLLNKQTGRLSSHILFDKSFSATKDKDGDRIFDLLTIRVNAAYVDDDGKQELRATQYIHLWLEQAKSAPANSTPAKNVDPKKKDEFGSKSKPYKLEAFEKVQLRSPELNIRDANHLTVCFRDKKMEPQFDGVPALPAIGVAPQPVPTLTSDKNDAPRAIDAKPLEPSTGPRPIPGPPNERPMNPTAAATPEKDKAKPKRPVELTAGELTAYVAINGSTYELLEFVAENNVHVTQQAELPKDKGLDLTGNMLNLIRKPGGDILHVFGESRKLAQLQFNEMFLFGPKITIDQVENIANVEGTGAMHMPSNTSLDGKKKDCTITIHWNKSMWFNGRSADFDGGVEAFQDSGKLRCQQMQVTMDRPVSFKEQKSGQPPAKIDKILCNGRENQQVFILEEEREPKTNKILLYRRLLLAVVEVDNIEQRLNGSGPGVVDVITESSAGEPLMGGKDLKAGDKKGEKKEDAIFKWTRVRFNGQMVSYPTIAGGGRQTTFLDQVRVYHQPGDDPNLRDPVAVGKGGLFLTCQRLTIVQRKVGDKSSQELIADGAGGMVNFQTEELSGNCKVLKYDEAQEQIVFEGTPATIYKKANIPGMPAQRFQGNKLLYNRKTGELLADGVRAITSKLAPGESEDDSTGGRGSGRRIDSSKRRDGFAYQIPGTRSAPWGTRDNEFDAPEELHHRYSAAATPFRTDGDRAETSASMQFTSPELRREARESTARVLEFDTPS